MASVMSLARHIERREFAEACKRIDALVMMLRQRDFVLGLLLERCGAQVVPASDLMRPECDFEVVTEVVGETVVFRAIKTGGNDAAQEGTQPEGDQREHTGDGQGAEAREDGAEARGVEGARDGRGGGDAHGAGAADGTETAREGDVKGGA